MRARRLVWLVMWTEDLRARRYVNIEYPLVAMKVDAERRAAEKTSEERAQISLPKSAGAHKSDDDEAHRESGE